MAAKERSGIRKLSDPAHLRYIAASHGSSNFYKYLWQARFIDVNGTSSLAQHCSSAVA